MQLFRDETARESLLSRVSEEAAEALSKLVCVTVLTAGTDLCAASNRVPGSIRPLDFRLIAHDFASLQYAAISLIFAIYSPRRSQHRYSTIENSRLRPVPCAWVRVKKNGKIDFNGPCCSAA